MAVILDVIQITLLNIAGGLVYMIHSVSYICGQLCQVIGNVPKAPFHALVCSVLDVTQYIGWLIATI